MAEKSMVNLNCSLCLDVYDEATLLNCGHSFCRKCLEMYDESHQSEEGLMTCPLCRHETELGAHRVAGLSANVAVNALVDEFHNTNSLFGKLYEELPKCSQCQANPANNDKENVAVAFCYNCGIMMCESCKSAHDRLDILFGDHKVVSVKDLMSGKERPVEKLDKCPEHKSENREFYCSDCRRIICHKCTIVQHNVRDHVIRERAEFEAEIRGKIDSLVERSEEQRRILENQIRDLEQERRDSEAALQNVLKDIDDEFDDVKRKLEKRKTALKEISDTMKCCNERLDETKTIARKLSSQLSSSEDLLAQGRRGGLEGESLVSHDHLCNDLEELIDTCIRQSGDIDNYAGEVRAVAQGVAFIRANMNTRVGDVVGRPMVWEMTKEIQLPDRDMMNGLCIGSAECVLVGRSNNGVDRLTVCGNHMELITLNTKVYDVSVLPTNHTAVLTIDSLEVYNEGTIQTDIKYEIPTSGSVKAMDSNSEGYVYVCYWNEHMIHVFPPTGGKPERSIHTTKQPQQVHTTRCGKIVMKSNSSVLILKDSGEVLAEITEPSQVKTYPSVDEADNLYVAKVDQERSVVLIDRYTLDGDYVESAVKDFTFKIPERMWYYMQCLSRDTIVFCTPGTMYVFKKQWHWA